MEFIGPIVFGEASSVDARHSSGAANVFETRMIGSVALVFACLLIGEAVSRLLKVPVPGAVIGMGLLLGWLAWRSRPTPKLDAMSAGLIACLPVMFVPAAVGIMHQGATFSRHGLAFGLALVVSTVLTLLVTALVFRAFSGQVVKS